MTDHRRRRPVTTGQYWPLGCGLDDGDHGNRHYQGGRGEYASVRNLQGDNRTIREEMSGIFHLPDSSSQTDDMPPDLSGD
jgi:hypothetical protein